MMGGIATVVPPPRREVERPVELFEQEHARELMRQRQP